MPKVLFLRIWKKFLSALTVAAICTVKDGSGWDKKPAAGFGSNWGTNHQQQGNNWDYHRCKLIQSTLTCDMIAQVKAGDRMTGRQTNSSQTSRSGTSSLPLLRISHTLQGDMPLKTGTPRSGTMIQPPTGVETTGATDTRMEVKAEVVLAMEMEATETGTGASQFT